MHQHAYTHSHSEHTARDRCPEYRIQKRMHSRFSQEPKVIGQYYRSITYFCQAWMKCRRLHRFNSRHAAQTRHVDVSLIRWRTSSPSIARHRQMWRKRRSESFSCRTTQPEPTNLTTGITAVLGLVCTLAWAGSVIYIYATSGHGRCLKKLCPVFWLNIRKFGWRSQQWL